MNDIKNDEYLQRKDRFGKNIKIGSKEHKLTFRDDIEQGK